MRFFPFSHDSEWIIGKSKTKTANLFECWCRIHGLLVSWSGSRMGSELSEQFNHLLTAFSDCPNQLIICGCQMQGGHSVFVLGLDLGSGLEEHFNHLLMATLRCPMQGGLSKRASCGCPMMQGSLSKRVGLDVGSGLEEHLQPPSHGLLWLPNAKESLYNCPWHQCRLRPWGALQPPAHGHCRLPKSRESF